MLPGGCRREEQKSRPWNSLTSASQTKGKGEACDKSHESQQECGRGQVCFMSSAAPSLSAFAAWAHLVKLMPSLVPASAVQR